MRRREKCKRRTLAAAARAAVVHFETLEERKLLSANFFGLAALQRCSLDQPQPVVTHAPLMTPHGNQPIAIVASSGNTPQFSSPQSNALIPSQLISLYDISGISFGNLQGSGAGQTIAIIDAFNDPDIATDLGTFDSTLGIAAPPSFTVVNDQGQTSPLPSNASPGTWDVEESLDVEWAHALAPQANILLVEGSSTGTTELDDQAVNAARNYPGVSVVSMSYGAAEFGGENSFDQFFTTPVGHNGITFVASTGDDGAPGAYPAFSPNVVAVGGTVFNSINTYTGETGWSDGGGGISQYESQPGYQSDVVTQSSTARTIPDVAMDAGTPVNIVDSYAFGSSPWATVTGTSIAAPCFAALVAIADQGRALASLPTLDGPSQTLPAIYSVAASDFNDITSGNNGFAAGPGYDLVTGRGSPIANLLIPDVAGVSSITGNVFQDNNGDYINDAGDVNLPGTTMYLDANNNDAYDAPTTRTVNSGTINLAIPNRILSGVNSNLNVSGTNAPITNISVTLNITDSFDADLRAYLTSPNGTEVALFTNPASGGANFTNTVISGTGTNFIFNGTAPYTGTFAGSTGELTTFNGLTGSNVNGTWTLKVVDSVSGGAGTLNSWSLAITTAEAATTTDSNGHFGFTIPNSGTVNLRQLVPTGEVQISPGHGVFPAQTDVVTVNNRSITGQNFADFSDVFSTSVPSANYYLVLAQNNNSVLQIYLASTPSGFPTYQVPIADLQSLAFNLSGNGDTLFANYSNGNPVPSNGITFNGTSGDNDNLTVIGQSPSQTFAMTDSEINATSQPQILYTAVSTMSVINCTVNYTGNFNGFQELFVDATAIFNWL